MTQNTLEIKAVIRNGIAALKNELRSIEYQLADFYLLSKRRDTIQFAIISLEAVLQRTGNPGTLERISARDQHANPIKPIRPDHG